MTDKELKKLQSTILIISDEIKRICLKNNIPYSVDGGSLIGAVRHKGFIPWDDDFDVDMTRENYERFIAACERDLGDKFTLQTWENDKEYPKGFCKVLLNGTKVLEKETVHTRYKKGIYVDIFPWDYVPDNILLEKLQQFEVYFYKKVMQMHGSVDVPHNSGNAKRLVFGVLTLISKFYSHDSLVEKYSRALTRYNSGEYVACMVGVYGYKKTKVKSSVFDELIELPFEDRMYSAVKDFDYMLTNIYGDYMKLPPVEKRRIHDFIELDFGPY